MTDNLPAPLPKPKGAAQRRMFAELRTLYPEIANPEDAIMEMARTGDTFRDMAEKLGVSTSSVHGWVFEDHDRRMRFREARKASAALYAERAGEVLDDINPTTASSVEVNLAAQKSRYKQWIAGKYDSEWFGDAKAQVNVSIDFGSTFADVLRSRMDLLKAKPVQNDAPTVDGELIEDAPES